MANLFQWIASAYCRTPYSSSRALLSLINVFFFSYYFFFFAAHYHQFSLFHASYADDAVQMKRECQFPLPPNIFWLSHMYTINQHELGLIICNKIRNFTLLIEFLVDQNAVPVAANDVWYAPNENIMLIHLCLLLIFWALMIHMFKINIKYHNIYATCLCMPIEMELIIVIAV